MSMTAARCAARSSEPHTILVVEDEVLIRLLAADELRVRGFGVLEASNADEAIAFCRAGFPSISYLQMFECPVPWMAWHWLGASARRART